MFKRVFVIYNPMAGRHRAGCFKAYLKALENQGAQLTVYATEHAGHAINIVRDIVTDEPDLIIAAGGDGLVNEVVNGLAGHDWPLAVMPLGTANVLAHELGLPFAPKKWAHAVMHGTVQPVYLGRAGSRYFTLMCGVGFDGLAVAGINLKLKKKVGKAAYVLAGLKVFGRLPKTPYNITVDGEAHTCASAIICNAHYYGGRFVLAPNARITDKTLYAVLFNKCDFFNMLGYLLAIALGRLDKCNDVKILPASEIKMSHQQGGPVQADGDHVGELPVKVRAAAQKIQLVFPVE